MRERWMPIKRKVEHGLGHEIPVTHCIEAVVECLGKTEVCGVADRVDRERRAGERAGAKW